MLVPHKMRVHFTSVIPMKLEADMNNYLLTSSLSLLLLSTFHNMHSMLIYALGLKQFHKTSIIYFANIY